LPRTEPFFARLARALSRRPAIPLLACAAFTAAGAFFASRVEVDPGYEGLVLREKAPRAALETLERVFASEEVVLIALEGPVFTEAGLARLERATKAAAAVPGVRSAVSLANAKNIYQGPVEVYAWAPYERVKDGEMTPDELRAEALAEPLFAGTLVSRDGRMAAITCAISSGAPEAVEGLRAVARAAAGEGFEAFVAGFPIERQEFAERIRRDRRLFVPLVVLVLATMTGLLFRQLWGVVLPLAAVAVSVAGAAGLAGLAGVKLDPVTSMLEPVVMVVAVTASVNVLTTYAQIKEAAAGAGRRADWIAAAFGRVGLPCFLTTLTTVFGFLGLAVTDIRAIREFGLLSAFGVGLSFVAALALLPPLLSIERSWGPGSLCRRRGKIEGGLAHAAPLLARARFFVLAAAAACAGAAALGVARLRVETNVLAELPPASELAKATRAIDRSLGGVNAFEVLLEGPPGAFRRLGPLRGLAALEAALARIDGVRKTISIADLIARIEDVKRRGRRVPESEEMLEYDFGLLDRAEAAAARDPAAAAASPLRALLSPDAAHARLQVRLEALPASKAHAIIEEARRLGKALMPPGTSAVPTGPFVLMQDMTAALPRMQVRGLVFATVLIVASIAVFLRSARLGALAAVPASVPILAVYGLMGFTGIDLSTSTAMISAVVLGLAVDSTILFLSRYRDERRRGLMREEAVARMLESAGQSVSYSNLTLVFGFAVGLASSFPPIRHFALLSAATIAASYLSALILLPALIFVFGARVAPRGAGRGGCRAAA
jgi:predicted RND superfamily exporter protein